MKLYVYLTDWECFWNKERQEIAQYAVIWSLESDENLLRSNLNDYGLSKIIISKKPITIELALNNYTRPILICLGIYESTNYPRECDDLIVTRSWAFLPHYFKLSKLSTGGLLRSISNIEGVEESDLILDAIGIYTEKKFTPEYEDRENINEIE